MPRQNFVIPRSYSLVARGDDHRCRIHLSLQRITVFVKNEIHTPIGILGFFVETAVNLLFLTTGCANGHFFLFTKIGCWMSHHVHLAL